MQHSAPIVRGNQIERSGAGCVSDERPGGHRAGGGGDLAIRHAEQHHVGATGVRAASERFTARVEPGSRQGTMERGSEAAGADYREARGGCVLHVGPAPEGMPVASDRGLVWWCVFVVVGPSPFG